MLPEDRIRITHMRDACESVSRFIQGKSRFEKLLMKFSYYLDSSFVTMSRDTVSGMKT